ncbi:HesA/MoeB/ThiF family protein [Sphingomonas sp.]|uniref:HesA/MoeB/ThiF family protein n=1 Tax=Sphingomonas sp. TaxID=28214 RepID=UPI0018556AD6|nr:HesA/MoeB/ThiF family protein [Sphingomonas sp.]MBA3511509.1 HesA/MoeB/ThiF family protein [Sphingomonas sp.]
MSLSDAELDRYARHIVLREVGGPGQRKLKAASVALIGAGAIGSAALPALAGAGVGRLTVIEDDVVELSNLHRQLIFREDQVGQPKTEAAAAFARSLNSHVEVDAVAQRIDGSNSRDLLAGHDLVLDGSDNFVTRLAVNEACVSLAIPLVSAAAAQFQAQVALLRGWEADQPCYRCFVGDAFDSDDCDTCAELGVLGALTGTAGHFAALTVLRALLGIGEDVAGKLFLLDAAALSWRQMTLPKDPGCKTCGRIG